MRSGAWRRAGALVIAIGLLFASAGTALAGRAWTIDASPTSLDENDTVSVTLDVRNTGGDGGGDEIGCVVITIPGEFSIEGASVASVKGASAGHGWVAVVSGSKVAFMEPDDSNVLVGLPQAGDSAVFKVAVTPTASGSSSWAAVAYDKPGSGTGTKCGSGTFPTKSLSFSVAGAPTPPTPAPTPPPTPAPTPQPTPAPTLAPTPAPARTAPPAPTPTPAPTATPPPGATAPPGPAATASPTPRTTAAPSAPAGFGRGAGPTASPSGDPADPLSPAASEPPDASPTPSPLIAIVPGGSGGGGGGSGGSGGAGNGSVGPASDPSLTVGRARDGRDAALPAAQLQDAALAAFGAIGFGAFTVPGLVVGVPGLLVVLAVVFQLVGGSAFVPIARRWQRGTGLGRRPVGRIVRTP